MKKKLFTLLSVCTLFTGLIQSQPLASSKISGLNDSWFEKASAELQKIVYRFQKTGNGEYLAANSKQGIGVMTNGSAYTIFPLRDQGAWKVTLTTTQIKRGVLSHSLSGSVSVKQEANSIFFETGGQGVFQYVNSPTGLKQDIVLNKKLKGKGPLSIEFEIQTGLAVSQVSKSGITFHTPNEKGDVKMFTDGLKVWDSEHRPLSAYFELQGKSLRIVVDDANATYPITIDPLNHTPDWTDNGQGLLFPLLDDLILHTMYGYSVSGAGDLNNDGFDDIVIGAPGFVDIISVSAGTFNLVNVGAAFVYLGSATGPALTPSEVLQPTTEAGALFGYSVSRAGDLNNDGFDDLVVGAPGDRISLTVGLGSASVQAGKVYVYYGGASFNGDVNSEPMVSITINLQQSDFGLLLTTPVNPLYGFSVSNAGDVNGDGFDDLLVGAPVYVNPLVPILGQGRADIFHGNATGVSATPSHSIVGNVLDGLFGFSVSTAGNVNGDAYSDVIIGSPADLHLIPVAVGGAYVFHGSATGINATTAGGANANLNGGVTNNTLFGFSVSTAGDVNGDGFSDVVIGEPGATEPVLQLVAVGKAHIFYGTATGVTATGSTQIFSPRRPSVLGILTGNLLLGFSVSNAGDLNCDGFGDVLIGEPGGTSVSLGSGVLGLFNANVLSGRAYVYYGRANSVIASPSYMVEFIGPLTAANLLGHSVSDAGDVNGDGSADLLIGSPNGTLDLSARLRPLVADALDYITVNSIGAAYAYFGCLRDTDLDFDNDGIPDAVDVDDDNDGIPDRYEFSTGKNGSFTPSADPSGDDDGDGILNYLDPSSTQCGGLNNVGICMNYDTDSDGIPNHFDLDSDNDGLPDVIEAGGPDENGDGRVDCTGTCDADSDGLLAPVDINDASMATYGTSTNISELAFTGAASPLNPYVFGNNFHNGVLDTDYDTVPDFLDIDSDNDGIYDIIETGGTDASGDGRVDYSGNFATVDADNDGLFDAFDADTNNDGDVNDTGEGTQKSLIVTATSNASGNGGSWTDGPNPDRFPVDFDSDVLPNYRDLESDSDGINDVLEAGGSDPDQNAIIGTGASNAALVNNDGYAIALTSPLISTDPDSDGDGRPNDDSDPEHSPYYNGGGATPYGGSSISPLNFRPDQDSDTRPNFLDLDSDNDSINDILENTGGTTANDANFNGMIDNLTDTDLDGIALPVDGAVAVYGDAANVSPVNSDNDNVPDYLDLDSDNDGLFDVREGGNPGHDANGDGIVNCAASMFVLCDNDLDGILVAVDGAPAVIGDAPIAGQPNTPPNSDTGPCADALPDYRDIDSMNPCNGANQDIDGTTYPDANNDGQIDGTDTDFDGIINLPGAPDNNQVFGGNTGQGSPLPVTLIDFRARQQQQTVLVSWKTVDEFDLSHFEVLRSTNGTDFQVIGTVTAVGSVTGANYDFVDLAPVRGNNYYRLKPVDIDASFSLSSIVMVKLAIGNSTLITASPNPARDQFQLRMVGFEKGDYTIEVYNPSGQLQVKTRVRITEYDHIQQIQRRADQTAGLYLVRISNDKTNQTLSTVRVLYE